ncbi:MAG: hypothetical protein ACR2PL_25555 [Dehalococcoidia bacterium]
MGRRTRVIDHEEMPDARPARPRVRLDRWADNDDPGLADSRREPLTANALPDALLGLCRDWGLEAWAGERDERGIWGFACFLARWLEHRAAVAQAEADLELQVIRLATNLFVILGAVIKPLPARPLAAIEQASTAVAEARQRLAAQNGPIASFPGSGRAMRRLTRVRGWSRLSPAEQTLAEMLLSLYLETLASLLVEPDPGLLLAASGAWLAVVRLQALPRSFDEHLLRATAWYLETLHAAAASRQ